MKAYFKNRPSCKVRRRFSQNVTLHLHACQLSAQPTDFHLLGARGLAVRTCELTLAMGLDPVEQRLVDRVQHARRRRDALAVVHQAHCLLLEFERVARP